MAEDKTPPADKADDAIAGQPAAVLPDDPETNEEVFAEAFAEFAAADDTDPATKPPPVQGQEDGDKAGAETPATTDDEAASGDEPSGDAVDDDSDTAAPKDAAEPKDIWADATPEQKAAFEAAQHENNSHKNRASAQNRKIAQLMASPKPAAEPAAEPPATPETDEDWEQFKEDYPEMAGPMEKHFGKRIATLESEKTALQNQVAGITDAQTRDATNAEEAVLAQRHPDWEQLTASEEFDAWLPVQPRYVQEGFARNGGSIVDGSEASDLMDLFVAAQAPEAEPPKQEPEQPKDTTNNGKATRRTRRLESAVSTESGQAGPGAGPPEGDFDAAFDHFAGQP